MATSAFSGNGNYRIDVDAALVSQDAGTKTSTIYWRILVTKTNHFGFSASGNTGSSGWADSSLPGYPDLWQRNGDVSFNFQNGSTSGSFLIKDGHFTVPHNSDGTASYHVDGGLTLAQLGSASASTGWRSLPRIGGSAVPQAPTAIGIFDITQTTMRYQFSGNGDGGSPIREWEVHWGLDPNVGQFSERGGTVNTGNVTVSVPPARRIYFWARGRNDAGWGPWSARMDAKSIAGAKIKVNGVWRDAVPWIKVNGVWRIAQPYQKKNGTWRKTL